MTILTARLRGVSERNMMRGWRRERGRGGEGRRSTKTIPEPQEPDQVPPVKEIQLRWPKGVTPTEILGLRVTDIRKSRFKDGCGRERLG